MKRGAQSVSTVVWESLTPSKTDILVADSDDRLDSGHRAAKRRRIEGLANAYLKGDPIFIQSASLRGPFEDGWVNPWESTSRSHVPTRAARQDTARKRPQKKISGEKRASVSAGSRKVQKRQEDGPRQVRKDSGGRSRDSTAQPVPLSDNPSRKNLNQYGSGRSVSSSSRGRGSKELETRVKGLDLKDRNGSTGGKASRTVSDIKKRNVNTVEHHKDFQPLRTPRKTREPASSPSKPAQVAQSVLLHDRMRSQSRFVSKEEQEEIGDVPRLPQGDNDRIHKGRASSEDSQLPRSAKSRSPQKCTIDAAQSMQQQEHSGFTPINKRLHGSPIPSVQNTTTPSDLLRNRSAQEVDSLIPSSTSPCADRSGPMPLPFKEALERSAESCVREKANAEQVKTGRPKAKRKRRKKVPINQSQRPGLSSDVASTNGAGSFTTTTGTSEGKSMADEGENFDSYADMGPPSPSHAQEKQIIKTTRARRKKPPLVQFGTPSISKAALQAPPQQPDKNSNRNEVSTADSTKKNTGEDTKESNNEPGRSSVSENVVLALNTDAMVPEAQNGHALAVGPEDKAATAADPSADASKAVEKEVEEAGSARKSSEDGKASSASNTGADGLTSGAQSNFPEHQDSTAYPVSSRDFCTQNALLAAEREFREELVSPVKNNSQPQLAEVEAEAEAVTPVGKSSVSNAIMAGINAITPFFRFNASPSAKSQSQVAMPSTQELFDAASPFAFSTVKKATVGKRTSFAPSPTKEGGVNGADSIPDPSRPSLNGDPPGGPQGEQMRVEEPQSPVKKLTGGSGAHLPKLHKATTFSITPNGSLKEISHQAGQQIVDDGYVNAALDDAGSFLQSWDLEAEIRGGILKGARTAPGSQKPSALRNCDG